MKYPANLSFQSSYFLWKSYTLKMPLENTKSILLVSSAFEVTERRDITDYIDTKKNIANPSVGNMFSLWYHELNFLK